MVVGGLTNSGTVVAAGVRCLRRKRKTAATSTTTAAATRIAVMDFCGGFAGSFFTGVAGALGAGEATRMVASTPLRSTGGGTAGGATDGETATTVGTGGRSATFLVASRGGSAELAGGVR